MSNLIMDFSNDMGEPTFNQLVSKFYEEIDEAIRCKIHSTKRLMKDKIATKIYNQYIGRFFDSNFSQMQLTRFEAIDRIAKKMVDVTHRTKWKVKSKLKTEDIVVVRGTTINDHVYMEKEDGEIDMEEKKIYLDFLPLHTPDIQFNEKRKKRKMKSEDESKKEYIKRRKKLDKKKFDCGKNHYVNGLCYSSPIENPQNLHFINRDKFQKTDLIFNIAGTELYTSVRIRKVKDNHPILNNAKVSERLSDRNINQGGNCRNGHFSAVKRKHYMFSLTHNDKGKQKGLPNKPMKEWNFLDKEFSAEEFAKLLESAMKSEFPETLEKIKELEKDSDIKYLGDYAHSIDISVNLVNAPHFDMGDAGYGIGFWLSSDGKSNSDWYFILPNATINGSKGVAIKLDHGVMIEWNGTEIKHCSSDPGFDSNQKLFGTFIGPKDKFDPSINKKKQPVIPKISELLYDLKKHSSNDI